ncbi:hypothetical protein BH11PSE8_BH11PSE8_39470 [soil metagenome]
MQNHIAALLAALTINLFTMALALPMVMGRVNEAARRAQWGVVLHAAGWGLLLLSGRMAIGGWADRLLSTASMACMSASLVLLGKAFDLWCGRDGSDRWPLIVALVMTLGYALGFSSYSFRVAWANGLLALQMVLVAAVLIRRPAQPVGRWRWLLVVSLMGQMVVTTWRGVLGGFFPESFPSFFFPHPVNYAFVLIANATTVLSLVGILLAHRDEAARALERLASLDGLTGVFNRRAWLALAQTEMSVSVRYDHPLAVMMIDLDDFKQINDTRGHEAGDRALQRVASALQRSVRTGDLVGRYGGEEFCVLMNHADSAAAVAFDQRLRQQMARTATRELGFPLTYSAGIAMRLSPDDTLEAILRRADATLYRAKAQGRDRTLAEPEPHLLAA